MGLSAGCDRRRGCLCDRLRCAPNPEMVARVNLDYQVYLVLVLQLLPSTGYHSNGSYDH